MSQVTFEAERGPGGGRRRDIAVDLSHSDIRVLEKASQALVQRCELFTNARDINDSYNKGKVQYDFRLRPEGRALGLTDQELGEQLRGAFFGSLALRLLRGTNEIEVRVKLPEDEREDIYNLEDLVIRTPSGTEVPLMDVADLEETSAFRSIDRRDGRRVVSVSMDIEPQRAVTQVIHALRTEELPRLREDFPGITWSFEGSDAEMRRAAGFDPAHMLDQSHNVTDPIESLMQSAMEVQRAYAQALIVDRTALGEYQESNDALMASNTLKAAFTTDVEPILAMARLENDAAIDPISAYRAAEYRVKISEIRPAVAAGTSGIV